MLIFTVLMFMITIFLAVLAVFSGLGRKTEQQNKRLDGVKDVNKQSSTGANGRETTISKNKKEKLSLSDRIKKRKKENKKNKIIVNKKKREKSNKKVSQVENMLMLAESSMTAEQFSMIKIILAAVAMGIAVIVCQIFRLGMAYLLLAMAVFGLLAMILPGRMLKSKVQKRQSQLRDELPDIMDLLVVSVEAGLGFDAALIRLYEKNKSAMMSELMQATRDIQRGMSKKEAYESLAKRCEVKELTSFLTALVQADQMGISIKSILRVQAETLRKERKRRAEEKALKAPVTMLIPMVIFIFPVIFIVLLGPAVMNIMEVLG